MLLLGALYRRPCGFDWPRGFCSGVIDYYPRLIANSLQGMFCSRLRMCTVYPILSLLCVFGCPLVSHVKNVAVLEGEFFSFACGPPATVAARSSLYVRTHKVLSISMQALQRPVRADWLHTASLTLEAGSCGSCIPRVSLCYPNSRHGRLRSTDLQSKALQVLRFC
jgi:hypothetical protein